MSYKAQTAIDAITLRSAAVLTTSYVIPSRPLPDGTTTQAGINIADWNQLVLYVQATLGSATDIRIRVEYSPDNSTWFAQTALDIGTPASSLVDGDLARVEYVIESTDNFVLPIPAAYRYMRIQCKATASGSGTSLTVQLAPGIA